MAEVMKKATRDSYGEALVELGQENPNIVVFDADLAGAPRPAYSKRPSRTASLIAALLRGI